MTRAFAAGTKAFVLAWLCTFAIAFQCILVPAHIHTNTAGQQFASAQDAGVDTATQKPDQPSKQQRPADESQSHCFICQQMALAGAAILPDTPAPILIQRDLSETTATIEIATVSPQPSHIWRSRAPPTSLQA